MQQLRHFFQLLLKPTSSFDYQAISAQIYGLMPSDEFPEWCIYIISAESANEELQTFAQIQLKNWVKQYFGYTTGPYREHILRQVSEILLNSMSDYQCSINYEALCQCLDVLTLEQASAFTTELMYRATAQTTSYSYLRYAYVIAAACRRKKVSMRSKEIFYNQFTQVLFPFIATVLQNAGYASLSIVKVVLGAYQQSMNSSLLQEHMYNVEMLFGIFYKLYNSHDQLKERVLGVYIEYVKQYQRITKYDEPTKTKYYFFVRVFCELLPYLVSFAISQLQRREELIMQSLEYHLLRIVWFAFDAGVCLPEDVQQQILQLCASLIEQKFNELIYSNPAVNNIFALSEDQLCALARQFDSQLYTPLISDYSYSSSLDTQTNSVLDELCRVVGSIFQRQTSYALTIQIDAYLNDPMFSGYNSQSPSYFYANTLILAYLFRHLALKLHDATELEGRLISIINFYRYLFRNENAFIGLWFVNAVINDLSHMANYTMFVSELANDAIESIPCIRSVGQFFAYLIFIKYRLTTLRAHRIAYGSAHALRIENLSMLTHLLLQISVSFPFYDEIYDSVYTACELFVNDNPEIVSREFAVIFKSLFTATTQLDQISDLLELFCTVFVIREAELDVETCRLVAYAVVYLLCAISRTYKQEDIYKLEIAANTMVAVCMNVEVSSFRDEIGEYLLQIMVLFLDFVYYYGDYLTAHTAHAIIAIVDVFCVWERYKLIFQAISPYYVQQENHNINFVLRFVYALAFPNSAQNQVVYALLTMPVNMNAISVSESQAVCVVLYFLMRQGLLGQFEACLPSCVYYFSFRRDLYMKLISAACSSQHQGTPPETSEQVAQACYAVYTLCMDGEYTKSQNVLNYFPNFKQVVKILIYAGYIAEKLPVDSDPIELELLGDCLDKLYLLSMEIMRSCY